MENRFTKCCFNFEVIGRYCECDRLNCKRYHNPVFTLYSQNNVSFYCLNQKQLGQYWKCIIEDIRWMCPSKGYHNPVFTLYRQNNVSFYCLNQKQLGQYWKCIIEDIRWMCPSECKHCVACK